MCFYDAFLTELVDLGVLVVGGARLKDRSGDGSG